VVLRNTGAPGAMRSAVCVPRWGIARRWLLAPLLGMAMSAAASGCGSGVFIFSVNTGTVVGEPSCGAGTGRFDLRDTGGLVLVVLIDSNTQIFVASGGSGTCRDVSVGAQAEVRGKQEGKTITATVVRLQ
jgi:hypothetical protein